MEAHYTHHPVEDIEPIILDELDRAESIKLAGALKEVVSWIAYSPVRRWVGRTQFIERDALLRLEIIVRVLKLGTLFPRKSYRQIGEQFGVSGSAISQRIKEFRELIGDFRGEISEEKREKLAKARRDFHAQKKL